MATKNSDPDYDFFVKEDLSGYIGQYVAIHNQRVEYHNSDLRSVYLYMKEKHPDIIPFITQVCAGQAMIL